MKNFVLAFWTSRFLQRLLLFASAGYVFGGIVFASATPPCSAGSVGETILPVKNSVQAYCVSDFGWSDSWFFSNPGAYDGNKDVLSGDDSPFIRYAVGPSHTAGNGNGFFSPSLDQGTLNPTNIGSNWSVIQSLAYSHSTDTATSVIQDATDHLVISILTQVVGQQVFLHFSFLNNGAQTIDNLRFGDYRNFHPNGSKNGKTENVQGTTSFTAANGTVTTSGNRTLSTFIADGIVFGDRKPDVHQVGTITDVLSAIRSNAYTGSNGPVGPGDYAAAIAWDLGSLAPGQSTAFVIAKELASPEPSTLVLLGIGTVLLAISRRKHPRK